MSSSRGKQPESYYHAGFVDTRTPATSRSSLERELERISQAFIKVREEIDTLRGAIIPRSEEPKDGV